MIFPPINECFPLPPSSSPPKPGSSLIQIFHQNIGLYCNRPENWQELIIRNWNELVAPHETVLHLGDFALLVFSHRPIVPLEDGWINLHGLTQ